MLRIAALEIPDSLNVLLDTICSFHLRIHRSSRKPALDSAGKDNYKEGDRKRPQDRKSHPHVKEKH